MRVCVLQYCFRHHIGDDADIVIIELAVNGLERHDTEVLVRNLLTMKRKPAGKLVRWSFLHAFVVSVVILLRSAVSDALQSAPRLVHEPSRRSAACAALLSLAFNLVERRCSDRKQCTILPLSIFHLSCRCSDDMQYNALFSTTITT